VRIVFMRMEGVLQSWGERSKWDERDTGEFPTKSGIVGLIGCCMGIPRGDERLIRLSDSLRVAIRADRLGNRLIDFHTVQADRLTRADGSSGQSGTIVSHRGYLQDASFLVLLTGPDEILSACANAIRHPVWPPCLGRRSCVPSRPLFEGDDNGCASIREALESKFLPQGARRPCRVWTEIEGSRVLNGALTRQDRLVAVSDKTRQFAWGSYTEDIIFSEGSKE
jgi:CRISPR system Cascade subunit CasD